MTEQAMRPGDITMLKSISEKEKEVETMIDTAHERAEAKIQEARRRATEIVEDARSHALEEKRMMKEKTLQAVREGVRLTEQEYEEILKRMAEKAKARVTQAVERVVEAVLPR